jgi:hypothetical protein
MTKLGEATIQGAAPYVPPEIIEDTKEESIKKSDAGGIGFVCFLGGIFLTIMVMAGCYNYGRYTADNKAFHDEEIFIRNKAIALAMLNTLDGVYATNPSYSNPMSKEIECRLQFGVDREEVKRKFSDFCGNLWRQTADCKSVGSHFHVGLHTDNAISILGSWYGRNDSIELVFKQITKEEKICDLRNQIQNLKDSIKDPLQEKAVILKDLDEKTARIKEEIHRLECELARLVI